MAESITFIGFNVRMLVNNDPVIIPYDDAQGQTIGGGPIGNEEYRTLLFEDIGNRLLCFERKLVVPVSDHMSFVRFLYGGKDFRIDTGVVVTSEMTQAFIHKPLTLSQPPLSTANSFLTAYHLPFPQRWPAIGASFYLSYGMGWSSVAATYLSDIVRYSRASRLLRVGRRRIPTTPSTGSDQEYHRSSCCARPPSAVATVAIAS